MWAGENSRKFEGRQTLSDIFPTGYMAAENADLSPVRPNESAQLLPSSKIESEERATLKKGPYVTRELGTREFVELIPEDDLCHEL